MVLEPLMAQGSHPLQDKYFHALFHQTMEEWEITEFYLLDESGSFLMLDACGQATWLLVRTEADMELFDDMANMESDVPDTLLKTLGNREKLYFCRNNQHQCYRLKIG